MMGHAQMWEAMKARDAIYANENATEDDYMRAAELEHDFAEHGGYTAEARAAALLSGLGIPQEQHEGPMSAVAPGWKLRVLLAQALFGDPDILLLDEPTNHLDINTIRWLEGILNERSSTMIIISHDRHFLSAVCTHMRCILDFDRTRRAIVCPCHDGHFDLNGNVVSGPPPAPLPSYEVLTRGGEVYVRV